MRVIPVLLLTLGCGPLAPGNTNDTGGAGVGCIETGWEPMKSSGMTFLSLLVNSSTFQATYVPGKDYPEKGTSGCFDPSSNQVSWIFEANNEALGALTMNADAGGNINLSSPGTSSFRFEFFGVDTASGYNSDAVSFGPADFVTGAWIVDSLDPVETSIQGESSGSPSFSINIAAAATRK